MTGNRGRTSRPKVGIYQRAPPRDIFTDHTRTTCRRHTDHISTSYDDVPTAYRQHTSRIPTACRQHTNQLRRRTDGIPTPYQSHTAHIATTYQVQGIHFPVWDSSVSVHSLVFTRHLGQVRRIRRWTISGWWSGSKRAPPSLCWRTSWNWGRYRASHRMRQAVGLCGLLLSEQCRLRRRAWGNPGLWTLNS